MYIQKRFPLLSILKSSVKNILFFTVTSVIPVFLYEILNWRWLHLPWLPIALIGTAVAFIIGFKNNASYDRLWEARKIYGGIVNASRSFAMMVNDYITNFESDTPLSKEDHFKIKKQLIMRHTAWMTSLRHALREHKPWEYIAKNKTNISHMSSVKIREKTHSLPDEIKDYLTTEEKQYVLEKTNKQAACLNLQSRHIRKLHEKGYIDKFKHIELEKLIVELFSLQGKAERIKNFPYPRQFATLNYYFVWIFVLLLPFGVMHVFSDIGKEIIDFSSRFETNQGPNHDLIVLLGRHFVWFSIPFSIVISWIFQMMEKVGEYSENPFEGTVNDIPITTISRAIEIDIREMIEENSEQIPKPFKAQQNVQL